MKTKRQVAVIGLLVFAAAFLVTGCSENSISSPGDPVQAVGIHVDDIQWIPAKSEFAEKFTALRKFVVDGKLITASEGGVVGGPQTYNNSVNFPPNAVDEDTYVTVEVKQSGPRLFYVEFLPSGNFNEMVEVTLSWAHLDLDAEHLIESLKIYYSQDNGKYWFPADSEILIDPDLKTATFKIDHFTRFGWGI